MASLLDMPEVQTPPTKYYDRSGADTPQSILKVISGSCNFNINGLILSTYIGRGNNGTAV